METTFVSGGIYRFYLTIVNSVGESLPSKTVRITLAALPSAPASLAVDISRSSLTSLYIYFSAVASSGIAITGYQVYISTAS